MQAIAAAGSIRAAAAASCTPGSRPSGAGSLCGCRCSWAPACCSISPCAPSRRWWAGRAVALPALRRRVCWRAVAVPRAVADGACRRRDRLRLGAVRHRARAAARVAADAMPCILTGTVRAVELLPEGRRITLEARAARRRRPPLTRWLRVRLSKDDRRRSPPATRCGVRALVRPPAAARLSGRLGPAARRVLLRPRRVRLRAGPVPSAWPRRRPSGSLRWCSGCARRSHGAFQAAVPGAGGRGLASRC